MKAMKSKGTKKVNKWKEKAKARSSELKFVKLELVRVKKSRVKWRSKYKGIQSTVRENKVANHCYSLEIMTLGVFYICLQKGGVLFREVIRIDFD
jgi:hypothetical protein